jgi:hypothetical protein
MPKITYNVKPGRVSKTVMVDASPDTSRIGAYPDSQKGRERGNQMSMKQTTPTATGLGSQRQSADLIEAAQSVVDNWEKGDLAQAVRELSEALQYALANPQTVKVEVTKGAAEATEIPAGIKVIIIDHDMEPDDVGRFEYELEDGEIVVSAFGFADESELREGV